MIVYLDGNFIERDSARVSAFDRGFIFGDGLYEGLRAVDGVIVGLTHHVERLRDGMRECRLEGFDPERIAELSTELLVRNGLRDAFVYWQVTRGAPAGDAPVRSRLPVEGQQPTVFAYAMALPELKSYQEPQACSACVVEDTRWLRGHVKSISLLGNVLGAMEAAELGGEDAIFARNGVVAEGSSTNVFLSVGGQLLTPSLKSAPMLAGVTRRLLLEGRTRIVERVVGLDDLRRADEIMLVGTLSMVRSVTTLDGQPVGDGKVGREARELLGALVDSIRQDVHSRHGAFLS